MRVKTKLSRSLHGLSSREAAEGQLKGFYEWISEIDDWDHITTLVGETEFGKWKVEVEAWND